MKKNLIVLSALFLIGITQVYSQCCKPTNDKAQIENSTLQKGKIVKLRITGMTCAGCSNHISNALNEVDGIIEYNVQYPGDLATIQYDPNRTNQEAIIKVIEQTGYKAEVMKDNTKKKS